MKRTVLYLENDTNDALLVKRALELDKQPVKVFVVRDGCDASDWLMGRGVYRDRKKFPQPDVLILDLRMPRSDGFDLIEFMQARSELKTIPIVVYTGSENPADKIKASRLGVNVFIQKSTAGLKDLAQYVRLIVATLPLAAK